MTTPFPSSVRRVLFQMGDLVRTGAEDLTGDEMKEVAEETLWVVAINTSFSSAGSFILYRGHTADDHVLHFTNFYGLPDGSPPRLATEQERMAYQTARKAYVAKANAEYAARQSKDRK